MQDASNSEDSENLASGQCIAADMMTTCVFDSTWELRREKEIYRASGDRSPITLPSAAL